MSEHLGRHYFRAVSCVRKTQRDKIGNTGRRNNLRTPAMPKKRRCAYISSVALPDGVAFFKRFHARPDADVRAIRYFETVTHEIGNVGRDWLQHQSLAIICNPARCGKVTRFITVRAPGTFWQPFHPVCCRRALMHFIPVRASGTFWQPFHIVCCRRVCFLFLSKRLGRHYLCAVSRVRKI